MTVPDLCFASLKGQAIIAIHTSTNKGQPLAPLLNAEQNSPILVSEERSTLSGPLGGVSIGGVYKITLGPAASCSAAGTARIDTALNSPAVPYTWLPTAFVCRSRRAMVGYVIRSRPERNHDGTETPTFTGTVRRSTAEST
jgi:hypothetical protein